MDLENATEPAVFARWMIPAVMGLLPRVVWDGPEMATIEFRQWFPPKQPTTNWEQDGF